MKRNFNALRKQLQSSRKWLTPSLATPLTKRLRYYSIERKFPHFFNTKIHFSYHLNNENTRLNPIFRRNVDIIVGFLQRTVNGLVHDNGIGCLCCADNIHTSWLFPHYWWKTWIFSQSVQSDSLKIFRRLCGFSFEKIVSIFKNKSQLLKLNSIVIHS